jgi:type VI secretion system protein ImpM
MTAGWWGKIPTLGDFAQRRLDGHWVGAIDAWLSRGLAEMQQAAPETWLSGYLVAPVWRFALMPGALADAPGLSLGVLMPSVDRVGRYFPLLLAATQVPLPEREANWGALWAWLAQIEAVAVEAVHQDWSADQLDAALLERPLPLSGLDAHFDAYLATEAARSLAVACPGQSLWWRPGDGEPSLQAPGLPAGLAFHTLFTA